MRRQSSLWRLAVASIGLLVLNAAVSAQNAEVHLANDNLIDSGPPAKQLPVLFVHGHNLLPTEQFSPNYRKNWQDSLGPLPSFKATLGLQANAWMDIEEYYIRFTKQGRSITEDACEIGKAIELILRRHDPQYPAQPTSVQVVIIAYSKGTISTRLYLKSLQEQVVGLPAPRPGFRPVSEFIAISPPNHGINSGWGSHCAAQQLMNGYDDDCKEDDDENCDEVDAEACATSQSGSSNFIESLNGHPLSDTKYDPNNPNRVPGSDEREAPDSRSPSERPADGILYVTLYAHNNRDFVGGDTIVGPPNNDCQGRRLARNLSPDAVNIPVSEVSDQSHSLLLSDGDPAVVHQNTVHTPEVICKALYAAVHHRSPLCATCTLDTGKPVIPQQVRAAAMLALDFSGSMAAPAGPLTRVAVLKDAVQVFLDVWSQFGDQGDRLGVTYFRTDVRQFHPVSNQPLPPFSAGHAAIIQDLIGPPGQTPSDLTAMGGGLQSAIEALRDPSVTAQVRRVILFTDGMQNVNPMVRNVSGQLVIADEPGRMQSNVIATSPPTVLNSSLCVSIDTIGVGTGAAFVDLLNEIATETGGRTWLTPSPEVDLRQFFIEELINALRGFSPQLVAYRRGAVAAKGSTEAFAIEDGVRKLVLKVSWKRGESIDFTVSKDGVDVTSAGRVINGAFYKIFTIDLPARGPIAARGNWQVRINGKAATTYEAAAIVDGGQISYDAVFDTKRPKTGDPLDLVVRLAAAGRPIAGSPRVTVTLMSPTATPGDIIAKNPPKDLPAFEPGMTIAERQLLALTLDPRTSAALKPKQEKFVLQSNNKGEFRTQLRPKVPGIYTALVTIDGDGSGIGQFSRTLTATMVVRFANADLKASNIFVTECTDVVGRRSVRLVLTPRDSGGHYLGPGSPSAISLGLSTGRTVGGVRDLGDGGYMFLLEMARSDDPIITLEVAGGAFFRGPLSQLSRMSRP